MIGIDGFTRIDNYEDCPVDVPLLVWTGDSFDVTYVDVDAEYGRTIQQMVLNLSRT